MCKSQAAKADQARIVPAGQGVGDAWPPQFWRDLREEMERCVRTAREWGWPVTVDDLLEHFDLLSDQWQVSRRDRS